MIKIYTKDVFDSIVVHKKGKIEDNMEDIEHILAILEKMTGKKVWRYGVKESILNMPSLVVELSMYDEDKENIMAKILAIAQGKEYFQSLLYHPF